MTSPRAGLPYEDHEIERLVLEAFDEGARHPENLDRLAKTFGRSPGAIEMVMRWAHGADFPRRANNRISRQVAAAKKKLKAQGLLDDEA